MDELKQVIEPIRSERKDSARLWLPVAIKWGVGIYWYGMIAVTGIAVIFFIFVSTMTGNRFPFPFQAPVILTFPAMDSLEANTAFSDSTPDSLMKNKGVGSALIPELKEGLDEIEKMSFQAFALNGDLMFIVPMGKLWPFLMVGFFTPTIIALAIAFHLRKILKSINLAKPFDPANIRRVKIIGWLVVSLSPLGSLVKYWSATSLLPQVADVGMKLESSFHFGFSSILFGILILALVHIFETGAKMQMDQELTI